MGTTVSGQAGPRIAQDGGITELRTGRMSELVTTNAHGKYYEAVSRGNVYTISTALAGTTNVAGNVAPPAAAAATILSLYNPLGSGINAIMMKTVLGNVSGTPGAGGFAYCSSWANRVTAAQNATPRCNLLGGKNPTCQGFTQTALTSGLVHVVLRPIGFTSFAAAVAAANPNLVFTDYLDGEIIVPPGGILTIASAATGTTHIVYAAMTWEEVLA